MEQQIITRATAMAEGLRYFYSGNVCKHGHKAKRYTSSGTCTQCGKHYAQAFRNNTFMGITEAEKAAGVIFMRVKVHPSFALKVRAFAQRELNAMTQDFIDDTAWADPKEIARETEAMLAKASPLERMMDRLAPPPGPPTVWFSPDVTDLGDGTRFVNDPAGPYLLYADGTKILT